MKNKNIITYGKVNRYLINHDLEKHIYRYTAMTAREKFNSQSFHYFHQMNRVLIHFYHDEPIYEIIDIAM